MPSQGIWVDSSLLDPFTNYSQGIKDTRPYYINRTDFNQDYIYITIDVMALVFWFQQIYIRSLTLSVPGGGSFLPPPRESQVYVVFEKGKFFQFLMVFQVEASNNPW